MTTETTETLLDRDAEREALRRTLADAREGRGRLVIVEGEAEIGKTALLGRARGAASDAGFTVLSAAGADLEREFAWGVARQLFEPLVYGASAAHRRSLLASFAANHGLYWLTANLADGTPAAMIVDDAHWADLASLLARTPGSRSQRSASCWPQAAAGARPGAGSPKARSTSSTTA